MAKRYTFRLETLLRLREQREDEQKRVVASRLREIRTLRQRREFLEEEISRQIAMMRNCLMLPRMEVDQVKSGRHWVVRLRRGMLETDAQIGMQRAMLAQERVTLASARKEKKVLGLLKDRQRELYLADLNRREQIELDETNSLRFARAALSEDEAVS